MCKDGDAGLTCSKYLVPVTACDGEARGGVKKLENAYVRFRFEKKGLTPK